MAKVGAATAQKNPQGQTSNAIRELQDQNVSLENSISFLLRMEVSKAMHGFSHALRQATFQQLLDYM